MKIHVFTKQLQDYCARRLAEGITLTDLYAEITAPEFPHKYGASYSQFTRQVAKKVTPNQIESYRATMDFTDPNKQIAYLSKLIADNIGSETDRLRALTLLREIQTEIGAKHLPTSTAGADDELPDRENQRFNNLFFGQLKVAIVLRCIHGFKGWEKLELGEIQMLATVFNQIIADKTGAAITSVNIAAQMSTLSEKDKQDVLACFIPNCLNYIFSVEDIRHKLKRLRFELSSLTEEELSRIQKENWDFDHSTEKGDNQDDPQ